ncbi:hypothetical protein Plhal703r1_c06g0032571 [Plasmopara halstedii]
MSSFSAQCPLAFALAILDMSPARSISSARSMRPTVRLNPTISPLHSTPFASTTHRSPSASQAIVRVWLFRRCILHTLCDQIPPRLRSLFVRMSCSVAAKNNHVTRRGKYPQINISDFNCPLLRGFIIDNILFVVEFIELIILALLSPCLILGITYRNVIRTMRVPPLNSKFASYLDQQMYRTVQTI